MSEVSRETYGKQISALTEALKRVCDGVEYDVNGTMGHGGNGGLTSDKTLRAAQEGHLLISRIKAGRVA